METEILPDFYSLSHSFIWKPIYGCPGRYILKEEKSYSMEDLIGTSLPIKTYAADNTNDEVWIVVLRNGGLISYKKQDGYFVHTLNTMDGFLRKLKMLQLKNQVFMQKEE